MKCGRESRRKIAVLFLSACIVSACADSDETKSPAYGFSTIAGTTWRTKTKVAVVESGRKKGLCPPMMFDPTVPGYTPNPGQKILAVLPVGTHVTIEHLIKDNGDWGGVWVTATVDTGPYAGKNLELIERYFAPNSYLRPGQGFPKTWTVNPDLLEK